jgi:hypothetical protein
VWAAGGASRTSDLTQRHVEPRHVELERLELERAEAMWSGGLLVGLRFAHAGLEVDVRRDPVRWEWRVRVDGKHVGPVHLAATADARTLAAVVVAAYFPADGA